MTNIVTAWFGHQQTGFQSCSPILPDPMAVTFMVLGPYGTGIVPADTSGLAPTLLAANAVTVPATGNPDIDGLLFGTKWSGPVTYSFPDSLSDYPADYTIGGASIVPGFAQISVQQQQAAAYAIGLITAYTNVQVSFAGTDTADIQIAQTSAANPTAGSLLSPTPGEVGDV
ncbi:hypothetical protein WDZ92_35230 [Nostoc sp. NIES-2111]